MKKVSIITNAVAVSALFVLASCATEDKMPVKPAAPAPAPAAKAEAKAPPAAKAPEKAKATKLAGDIGLLDTEKNYMILVTKEGKLVTLDFDSKTKVTKFTPTPSKMADIGLGTSATVTYTKESNKNIASGVEYKMKK
jgi:nucleoid-associated protein YgaU